jgi:thiosulfate dehydrogenase (quinone) large subunit
MNALGFILTALVAAAVAVGARYLIARPATKVSDLVGLFSIALFGAYAGSELFGELAGAQTVYLHSLSEVGPQAGGFFIVTGVIGALLLAVPAAYAMARAATGRATDVETKGIRDPRFAHFLFNDTRAAALWLGVRLYVGYEWLVAGLHKVTDPKWMEGGEALKGFFTRAAAMPTQPGAKPVITYDWYRGFIQYLLDQGAYTWFAKLVAVGEVLIGVGLLVGCLVGFAAFFGALMNFNFMLAGTASTNPVLFALAVALILAWKVAGYYGLDRYLLPALGAPWSPGRAFRHAPRPGASPA